jgi:hypothetical protein
MIFHFCGNNGYCMVLEIERSFLLDKFIYIEKLLKLSILKFPKQPEFGKFSIVMNNPLKNIFETGYVLNDKWVAIEFINKGAMGEVYCS